VNEAASELDEAFERLAASGFELANGFVNHGPMACEALAALGCSGEIDSWARRFARSGTATVDAVAPTHFDWRDAMGDYRRLPEWIGSFEKEIALDGWASVVSTWVPRLLPALAVRLFHGAIRTAHATRAVSQADTEPRRAELARALGYWAARFQPGAPALTAAMVGDVRGELARAAADGARRYLTRPNIFHLHGVTGAMAVELFVDHIPPAAATAGLAQVHAEHEALYGDVEAAKAAPVAGAGPDELARAATKSHDPHQVKLIEACRRGLGVTGDPVFAAAAETVTGLG
jgi:hypothetical protein